MLVKYDICFEIQCVVANDFMANAVAQLLLKLKTR